MPPAVFDPVPVPINGLHFLQSKFVILTFKEFAHLAHIHLEAGAHGCGNGH